MQNFTTKMSIVDNTINDKLNDYKIRIMEIVSKTLKGSYGPYGSHTLLYDKNSGGQMYTKDGKTILDNLNINGELANLILNELRSISSHIANTVGDATTSVILLSNILLNKILNDEEISKYPPYVVSRNLERACKEISEEILDNKKEFNSFYAKQIAYISSNGDEEIANRIFNLYEKYGNSIVLEPKHSPNNKEEDRVFDGATLDYCLRNVEFVNTQDGKSILKAPEIYYFKDPIDTKDMIEAVFTIINNNILLPLNSGKKEIPTLIIAPRFSRDFDIRIAPTLKVLESVIYSDRPQFAILEANKNYDILEDIMKLSGGMYIYKTLTSDNADQMEYDNYEFLSKFKGYADEVVIDSSKTIFKGLYSIDENGDKIDNLDKVIQNIENEITIESRKTSPNYTYIDSRKKRIRKLKSVVCYLYIASLSTSEKNNKFMIYEDVCTSVMNAAENGVGSAAVFELFRSSKIIKESYEKHSLDYSNLLHKLVILIHESTRELVTTLLETSKIDNNKIEEIIETSLKKNIPYNIIKNDYDVNLVTSIMSDVEILNALYNILGKLIITNQVLLFKEPGDIYN